MASNEELEINIDPVDINLLALNIINTDKVINKLRREIDKNLELNGKLEKLKELYQSTRKDNLELKSVSYDLNIKYATLNEEYLSLEKKYKECENIFMLKILNKDVENIEVTDNFIDLCKHYVEQGILLDENCLLDEKSTAKWHEINKILELRGSKLSKLPEIRKPRRIVKTCDKFTNTETILVDKACMTTASSITRATSTSCFITHKSVATNCPIATSITKTVKDILKATTNRIPELITRIEPIEAGTVDFSAQTILNTTNKEYGTIGVNTDMMNIRKKIGYIKKFNKSDIFGENLLPYIKKEEEDSQNELNCNSSYTFETSADANPQLAYLWKLFGDTMFALIMKNKITTPNSPEFSLVNNFEDFFNSNNIIGGIKALQNLIAKIEEEPSLPTPISDINFERYFKDFNKNSIEHEEIKQDGNIIIIYFSFFQRIKNIFNFLDVQNHDVPIEYPVKESFDIFNNDLCKLFKMNYMQKNNCNFNNQCYFSIRRKPN